MAAPLLRMSGISKRFGATSALRDVAMEVQSGRILALLGENGAGKSTLMKILSGAHAADEGTMQLAGQVYAPRGPHAARLAGIAMIYQELNLVPDLSVEDNLLLGQERHRLGWLRRGEQRRLVREALELLDHGDLDPRTPVRRLPIGIQQLVEIARALVCQARVIVFDEPTSSLAQRDVERLFQVIGRLRAAGLGIVYISHFLEEIRRICDDYLVLRDGQRAGAGDLASVTDRELVRLMVGRNVEQLFPRWPHSIGDPVLTLTAVSGDSLPLDVDLQVRRGEILGLAGLVGAGRTELLRSIFGLQPIRQGEVRLAGRAMHPTPRACIGAGLGMVSEDRKREGLALPLSLADNVTLSRLAPYRRFGCLKLGQRRQAVHEWLTRLGIKARDADQEVSELSGGNQQKVALARVLHQEAQVLLLDEPTRGIDVGTKAEIYRLIGQCAAAGKAVIFVSSYFPELRAICDRVAVMRRGRLVAVRAAEEWTEESLMQCALSGESGAT